MRIISWEPEMTELEVLLKIADSLQYIKILLAIIAGFAGGAVGGTAIGIAIDLFLRRK